MMTRKLQLFGLFCVTALVIVAWAITSGDRSVSSSQNRQQQQPTLEQQAIGVDIAQLPKNLSSCFSDREANKYRIWGESGKYKLIALKEGNQWQEAIVAIEGDSCQVLSPSGRSFNRALSAYVPQSVAVNLARQRYQKVIEMAGGREAFQEQFNEHASDPNADTYMPEEYVQVLRELGIQVSDNVVPVDAQGIE
jgi:hypothetical protein